MIKNVFCLLVSITDFRRCQHTWRFSASLAFFLVVIATSRSDLCGRL